MLHRVVIFMHREIHTGGQRYLAEVLSYLQHHRVQTNPIYLGDFPNRYRKLGLVLDCVICNIWLFKQVRAMDHLDEVVFFEDVYLRPRLFLFNILVRLFTCRLRTVVLVQNVLTNHRLLQNCILRKLDDVLAWLFFWQASLVLTNSEFIKQDVVSRGVSPDKTKVIYCGYESLYDEQVRSSREAHPENIVQRMLFVGQCEPYKGVDVLLHALTKLDQNRGHTFTVDIVGNTDTDASYYQQLLEIVERENLGEHVKFWGQVADKAQLRKFYERAGIFVLPSRYEGFGIVLLEAMSFGLPIVATTAGAIPELVKDGMQGILVPPDDPHALAEAIGRLLRSPGLRAEYGRNGFIFAWEKRRFYSWEAVGKRILSHLRTLESPT